MTAGSPTASAPAKPEPLEVDAFPSLPPSCRDQLLRLVDATNAALRSGGALSAHVKAIRSGFNALLKEGISNGYESRYTGWDGVESLPKALALYDPGCHLGQLPARIREVSGMPPGPARSALLGVYRQFLPAAGICDWLAGNVLVKPAQGAAHASDTINTVSAASVKSTALAAEIERALAAARPEYLRRFIAWAEADFAACCAAWGDAGPTLPELQRCGKSDDIRDHYRNIADCLSAGPLDRAILDPDKLQAAATSYVDRVFRAVVAKLAMKADTIESPVIRSLGSYQFTITGLIAGKPVQIKQDVMLNRSVYGKPFEQFPARITYDGRAISEARLKAMTKAPANDHVATHQDKNGDRLFIGVFPGGLSYADRTVEVDGDYKQLAFLPYATLELQWRVANPPADLRAEIEANAAEMQSKVGEQYVVSTCGQTVLLGSAIEPGPGA